MTELNLNTNTVGCEYSRDLVRTNLHAVVIEVIEKQLIADCLNHHRGNQTKTAKMLGISRTTLRDRMKLFGLRKEDV